MPSPILLSRKSQRTLCVMLLQLFNFLWTVYTTDKDNFKSRETQRYHWCPRVTNIFFKVHMGQITTSDDGMKPFDFGMRGADDSATALHAGVRDQQLAHSPERDKINNSDGTKGQIFGRWAPVVCIWSLSEGRSQIGEPRGTHAASKCQGAGEGEEGRGQRGQSEHNNTFHGADGKCCHAHSETVNAQSYKAAALPPCSTSSFAH